MSMWKEEFLELMTGPTIDSMMVRRAMSLKDENLPEKIYKYRSVNDYSIDNLRTDTVWVCSADKYNDPYECHMTIRMEEFLRNISKYRFEKIIDKVNDQVNFRKLLSEKEIEEIRKTNDPCESLMRVLLKKNGAFPEDMHERIMDIASNVSLELSKPIQST